MVKQEHWDAAIVQVKEQAGALHVLMNIVGSNAPVWFAKVDVDEWNKLFETNVTGTLRGIQGRAPLIKESGGGSIVNIGSVAGITGNITYRFEPPRTATISGGRVAAPQRRLDWRGPMRPAEPSDGGNCGRRRA